MFVTSGAESIRLFGPILSTKVEKILELIVTLSI